MATKSKESKKIVLDIIANTKFAKSTICAILCKPEVCHRLLGISSKREGRTKILLEYNYDRNNENNEIRAEKIFLRERECLGGLKDDIDEYNKNLDANPILKNVFDLVKITTDTKPRHYLEAKISALCALPLSDENLKNLFCTEGLDRFVKKIVVRVPASDNLKHFLNEMDIDLSIRDTKGLMDMALDRSLSESNANLAEIGLDNIDGAIFGCSSEAYPNWVNQVYRDTLINVFKSVPTFFMAKDNHLYKNYKRFVGDRVLNPGSKPKTVKDFTDDYQSGNNEDYSDMADELFFYADQLFAELGLEKRVDGNYEFTDTYFKKSDTEFILPVSKTLRKYGMREADLSELEEADDFKFFITSVTIAICMMVHKIIVFNEHVDSLLNDDIAKKIMIDTSKKCKDELMADFSNYDLDPHSDGAPEYCKPQIRNVTKDNLEKNIDDTNIDILGPKGGITTKNNGKLRYYTAAVVAVSARRWLDHIISNIELKDSIINSKGEILFDGLDNDKQSKLVKSILRNCLYKQYTDMEATIQNYLCVRREKARDGIEKRRERKESGSAFESTVETIVSGFCDVLKRSYDQ